MKKFYLIILVTCSANHLSFSQNIGIGTTSPTEKLQVAGNIAADTLKPAAIKFPPNAGAGKILTSDASGNASWQTNTSSSSDGNIGYGVWGDCATNGNISNYQPITDPQGGPNDAFGIVAMSGNYAAVGCPLDEVGANADQGSVSIYQWDGSKWVFMQKIVDATGAPTDLFGFSVSISGNYLIVGAYLDDVGANVDQGSASIYQYNGSSWVFMQKITDATGTAGDNFGFSVSISGSHALVSANLDDNGANANQGSASAYRWNGSSWILSLKILDATGAAADQFGYSTSISGIYCIIGAPGDQVGSQQFQGSASVYQWNGSTWTLMLKITDAEGQPTDNFGTSVFIDGNSILVGAPSDDVMGVTNGSTTTIYNHGSAIFYQRNGNTWEQLQKVWGVRRETMAGFGNAVCVSGDYAIIGASGDDVPMYNQGSATIYQRTGNAWSRLQVVSDPDGVENGSFGIFTAIDGISKRFAIGCTPFANSTGKALFGKIN